MITIFVGRARIMISQKYERISAINEIYSKTIIGLGVLIAIIGYMIHGIYNVSIYNYLAELLIVFILAIFAYINRKGFYKKILIYSLFVLLFIYNLILFGLSITFINYYLIQFIISLFIIVVTLYSLFSIKYIDFSYLKEEGFDNNYLFSIFYRKNLLFNRKIWYVMSSVLFLSTLTYFFNSTLASFMYASFLILCLLSFYSFIIFTVVYTYKLDEYYPD